MNNTPAGSLPPHPTPTHAPIQAGHGEEVQARRLRAKLRWARLRASLAVLVSAHAAARPMVPPRIAGPAIIRTAFVQRPEVCLPSCRLNCKFGRVLVRVFPPGLCTASHCICAPTSHFISTPMSPAKHAPLTAGGAPLAAHGCRGRGGAQHSVAQPPSIQLAVHHGSWRQHHDGCCGCGAAG